MELKATYTVKAPLDQVWERMLDPETVAACLPDCEQFEGLGDDRFRITISAKVAAVCGRFSGTVAIADRKPRESYRLIIDGRGVAGFATGESTVCLRSTGPEVCIDVETILHVGGPIAQVGQRLLRAASRVMMDRFFDRMSAKITCP